MVKQRDALLVSRVVGSFSIGCYEMKSLCVQTFPFVYVVCAGRQAIFFPLLLDFCRREEMLPVWHFLSVV